MNTLQLRAACAMLGVAAAAAGCNRQDNPPAPPKSMASSQGTTTPDTGRSASAANPPSTTIVTTPGATVATPGVTVTTPGATAANTAGSSTGTATTTPGPMAAAPSSDTGSTGSAASPPSSTGSTGSTVSDQRGMSGVAGSAAAATAGPVSGADRAFVSEAANTSLAEVEAARLVSARTDNADVKSLAQHMEQDHAVANDELKRIASQKSIDLPTTIGGEPRGQLSRLTTLSKPEVDSAFVRDFGVDAHQKAVSLFEREAREGQDPDLKAYAERTLPKLREHLEMAQRMQSGQAGQAGPSGASR